MKGRIERCASLFYLWSVTYETINDIYGYDTIKSRKGVATMTDTIRKSDLIRKLYMEKDKWRAIKGHDSNQDVTQENFIDNVILIYEWIIKDVEKM